MSSSFCQSPLEWETLLEYWLGELDPDTEAHTEEHYLGCRQCSLRLQELVKLAENVRTLTKNSGVDFFINEHFARKLAEHGLHVREYHVPRNGSVNCSVSSEDDFVLAYLEAPLEHVKQLDMVYLDDEGNSQLRLSDIPFNSESGNVVFSTGIGALRALPTTTLRIRLLAIDHDRERTLGEYTFNHTAQ